MPGLTAIFATAVAYLAYNFFGDSSSTSSSRPTGTTPRSPPSPPSASSRSQTDARGSAVNPSRSSFAPTQVSDSRRTFASTPAQAASLRPPTNTRVARATTQTQADLATLDQYQYLYGSDLAPPRARESRQSQTFPTSPHTPVSYPRQTTATRIDKTTASPSTTAGRRDGVHRSGLPPLYPGESRQSLQSPYSIQQTSTRISQSTTSTSTAAGHSDCIHCTALDSPYAGETYRTLLTSALSQAFYSHQRAPSPDATLDPVSVSPLTKSHTRSSSFGSDHSTTSSRRDPEDVWHSSNLVPDARSNFEFDAAANVEAKEVARDLREKARRSNREMKEARDRAKSARKRGDSEARYTYEREAISHESGMKHYDKKAAKIIFRENNKVRGHLSRCQCHAQPLLC